MNSMTGMGRARGRVKNSYLTVEVKSINHKFCEVNTRIPPRFQIFELGIAQIVKKKIARGKVDIWLGEEKAEITGELNPKALKDYYNFLKKIKNTLKLPDPITLEHIQS